MEKPIDTKALLKEYEKNNDIFSEESEKVRLTKEALWQLSETDRLLICLYSEIQSLRKLGELLGVSRTTAYLQIKQIKEKIKNYVAEHLSVIGNTGNNN
jgi:DNA-directed RNA polymerase specialized sigma subunit